MQEKDILFLNGIKKQKTIVTICSIIVYLIFITFVIYKAIHTIVLRNYINLLIIALIVTVILRIIVRLILFELNKKLIKYTEGDKENVI